MRLIWSKKAESRFYASAAYTSRKFGKSTALSFIEDILRQVELLCSFPKLGKIKSMLVGHRYEYRSLVVHPYFKLVYYINEKKETIMITNFFDTRQDPSKLTC